MDIGRIASMELNHKPVDTVRAGDSVAMKIEATKPEEATRLYGRHFDHKVSFSSKERERGRRRGCVRVCARERERDVHDVLKREFVRVRARVWACMSVRVCLDTFRSHSEALPGAVKSVWLVAWSGLSDGQQ